MEIIYKVWNKDIEAERIVDKVTRTLGIKKTLDRNSNTCVYEADVTNEQRVEYRYKIFNALHLNDVLKESCKRMTELSENGLEYRLGYDKARAYVIKYCPMEVEHFDKVYIDSVEDIENYEMEL